MANGRGVGESIGGASAIAWALATPFLRRGRLRWGATDDEVADVAPGDEIVAEPIWTATHAITVAAAPESVWPWVAQVGQGRGGFYSYEKLENLAGCRIQNAEQVLPEHQQVAVGDPIRLHVEAPPMRVAIVDPPVALVLHGSPAAPGEEGSKSGPDIATTWAFLLRSAGEGATRLISRTRYHHGSGPMNVLAGGLLLIEPISFVMERKMLRTIKSLAESA
jgi:hypothetical protein